VSCSGRYTSYSNTVTTA